ncbi:MAG TPA: response regulator transcription factor [Burkholderiales bacterium]|nr:response regulator transcription factor [Burkholderiales bacterium]
MQAAAEASTLKVYLVEDSPAILERLEALLATVEGARTVGRASRAGEAIEGILAERPDLVVLDLKLAEGSGFDVLRAVRGAAPGIDVYMLTNFASEPYRRLAERLGARDLFDKSTEFERVRDAVRDRAATAH